MAISIVQHKSTHGSAASVSLAFSSNNAAGNLLVYAAAGNLGTALSACTDNNANTITNGITLSGGNGAIRVDFVASSNVGACTVTASQTSANRMHLHIWEVSGITTSSPLDKTNTGHGTGTSQSISTTTATSVANELVFGFFYDQPNDDSLTAGSGFSPSEFSDGGSGNESSLSEVEIVSSTGVQTATCTCGASGNDVNRSILTFEAASGSTTVFEDDSFNTALNAVSVQQPEPVISVF